MRIPPIPNALVFNIVYGNVKPHCRAALTRLQQLRYRESFSFDEIKDVSVCEDEAEYARLLAKRTSSFLYQQPPAATRPCPICGETHVWKFRPEKKPDGCPSCGGKCNPIYECSRSFACKKNNLTNTKEKENQHPKFNSRKTTLPLTQLLLPSRLLL